MVEFNLSRGLAAFGESIGGTMTARAKREGEMARDAAKANLTQTHALARDEAAAGHKRKAAGLKAAQDDSRADRAFDQSQLILEGQQKATKQRSDLAETRIETAAGVETARIDRAADVEVRRLIERGEDKKAKATHRASVLANQKDAKAAALAYRTAATEAQKAAAAARQAEAENRRIALAEQNTLLRQGSKQRNDIAVAREAADAGRALAVLAGQKQTREQASKIANARLGLLTLQEENRQLLQTARTAKEIKRAEKTDKLLEKSIRRSEALLGQGTTKIEDERVKNVVDSIVAAHTNKVDGTVNRRGIAASLRRSKDPNVQKQADMYGLEGKGAEVLPMTRSKAERQAKDEADDKARWLSSDEKDFPGGKSKWILNRTNELMRGGPATPGPAAAPLPKPAVLPGAEGLVTVAPAKAERVVGTRYRAPNGRTGVWNGTAWVEIR